MTTCIVLGCEDPVYVKSAGLCQADYAYLRRGGDPHAPRVRNASPLLSAEGRLRYHGWTVTGAGCWEWNGQRDDKGYGTLSFNRRKHVKAHRMAFEVFNKTELTRADHVLHSCDNPPCINPDHLRVGTHDENMADMGQRLRSGQAKLTPEQVREIRECYASGERPASIGPRFGVTPENVGYIVRRVTWRHVT